MFEGIRPCTLLSWAFPKNKDILSYVCTGFLDLLPTFPFICWASIP